jgi:hypothetical protein
MDRLSDEAWHLFGHARYVGRATAWTRGLWYGLLLCLWQIGLIEGFRRHRPGR